MPPCCFCVIYGRLTNITPWPSVHDPRHLMGIWYAIKVQTLLLIALLSWQRDSKGGMFEEINPDMHHDYLHVGSIKPVRGMYKASQIATFMGLTWGPPGSSRPQMDPTLDPRTLLSGFGLWTATYYVTASPCNIWCVNIAGIILNRIGSFGSMVRTMKTRK